MTQKILAAVAAFIVLFVVLISLQKAEFSIERSTLIEAPKELIFLQVNNLRNMQDWAPWWSLDPEMRSEYSGPDEGLGSSFAWSGDQRIGMGSMTIIESIPYDHIQVRLNFKKPFEAVNISSYSFTEVEGGVLVKWTMTGKNNFLNKLIGIFVNMDTLVGNDFEKGLSQLKSISEDLAKK